MKSLSYIGILCIIGLFIYLIFSGEENVRSFEFTYQVDLESDNNNKTTMKTWIPVPQTIKGVQTISNEKIKYNKDKLECSKLTEDIHKNKYYYCEAKNNKIEKASVILTWDVKRMEHQNTAFDIDSDIYKKGTKFVPVGEPRFSTVIDKGELRPEKNKPIDFKKIYDYVLNGMHYGKPTDDENDANYKYVHGGKNKNTGKEWLPKEITYGEKNIPHNQLVKSQNKAQKYAYGQGNARYACDIGVGNCTDYHSYFISLCRTLGAPARFHMGFNIPPDERKSGEGDVKGYHCWADYYKKDKNGKGTWYPVDISEADKDPNKAEYYFGTLNKDRVEFTTGRDLKLKGRAKKENFFIYPLFEGTKKMKKGKDFSFKYKNI